MGEFREYLQETGYLTTNISNEDMLGILLDCEILSEDELNESVEDCTLIDILNEMSKLTGFLIGGIPGAILAKGKVGTIKYKIGDRKRQMKAIMDDAKDKMKNAASPEKKAKIQQKTKEKVAKIQDKIKKLSDQYKKLLVKGKKDYTASGIGKKIHGDA